VFTGIVNEVGRIASVTPQGLTITADKVLDKVAEGDSIAVNGVCLTVNGFGGDWFNVDIMPETRQRSNLGLLRPGEAVNLEKALTLDGLLGGHLVQGHIDAVGKITMITAQGEATIISIEAPPEVMKYVVEKGFIAIDGISLTITAVDKETFSVSVVDYTLKHTILGLRQTGDKVNLEVDIIAKYVFQSNKQPGETITMDFLSEHGFLTR
jgi:riboflavin synthase